MKKLTRFFLLISPLIIFGLLIIEYNVWRPPINPSITQPVSITILLEKPDVYQAPMLLSINGDVKNRTNNDLFIIGLNNKVLRVNCSGLNIEEIKPGMTLYIKGYSYYHDTSKNYFLAIEIYIFYSYSLYLSIPGLIIILIILFVVFKFNFKDFSFSRRKGEKNNA
ncbi:MAG: hypothetical protein EAX96_13515 [Candidatus Lokiarchaeota archaeon]|nr:hypothetical protein [Candidatus Lokiarchaeota archaeon]